jgi:hydrophobic/amphiphilic exporter-1 (mainly G- bacteria), HAE1 family
MDFAMLNLRERLDELRDELPETATRPRILRVDPESEPIMVLSVTGAGDLWTSKELAETVFRRRLEQLEGVAQATVTGGLDREIQVDVDPELLEAYGLGIGDVETALRLANVQAPGGTIMQGRYRYPLRTLGEFQTVEEIGEVVVGRQQTGAAVGGVAGAPGGTGFRLVRVRDVARVVDGYAERESEAHYNARESVGLLVFKEAGSNTVRVAREVEASLEQLREEFGGVSLDVASSQAGFISESISNVVQALVFGGILAFLVLFLFLRDTRYPVAIALAIPISVVGTFALMEAFGVSLNIMSLGGLALGVGMLVDNSIVVLENVFRQREAGLSAMAAAAAGAEEVQGAITASTLTTISVFGPIVYVEGVAGELFRDLSLAVAFSLLASLLVALTLLPALAGRFRDPGTVERAPRPVDPMPQGAWSRGWWLLRRTLLFPFWMLRLIWEVGGQLLGFWWRNVSAVAHRLSTPVLDGFDRGFARFAQGYHRVLDAALDRRGVVLTLSVLALGGAVGLGTVLDRDLLPRVDQGAFDVRLELPEGTTLAATSATARELEEILMGDEGVQTVFSRVGKDVQSYAAGDEATGLHTALLQVRVRDDASTEDVLERFRPVSDRYPVGTVTVEAGGATALGRVLGGTEADVAVRIQGEDLDLAFQYADEVQRRLAVVPSLSSVRVGIERGQPELQVEIDREAAAGYGIDPRVIAETVEKAMRGAMATEFVDFDRKIAVMVRYPEELRTRRETLEGIRIEGVPLRQLAIIQEAMGPSEIRREEQGRVVTVFADVLSGGLDRGIDTVEEVLASLPPPGDLRVEVGGENEEMRRSFRDLSFAFALALLLVYMILAAQFESFVHPATILIAVPLALVGAVFGLFVTSQGLNTMSLIGMVILVGIVVNDAIVKVDFIVQARARGAAIREAVLEAGRVRLRPIIMTTVTTVLGLLPMALGIGRGADLRAPLAISVIGGLLVATALTLIVIPVVFSLVEETRMKAAERLGLGLTVRGAPLETAPGSGRGTAPGVEPA